MSMGRIFWGYVWMFIGWVNFPGGLISQGEIFRVFIFHGENFLGNYPVREQIHSVSLEGILTE